MTAPATLTSCIPKLFLFLTASRQMHEIFVHDLNQHPFAVIHMQIIFRIVWQMSSSLLDFSPASDLACVQSFFSAQPVVVDSKTSAEKGKLILSDQWKTFEWCLQCCIRRKPQFEALKYILNSMKLAETEKFCGQNVHKIIKIFQKLETSRFHVNRGETPFT